jgi:hypothetical protein
MPQPMYHAFTIDHELESAHATFLAKYGYRAEEVITQAWTSKIPSGLLKLGPVYRVETCDSSLLQPNDFILVGGSWHKVALIDNGTVLTESDLLLTLPVNVQKRGH